MFNYDKLRGKIKEVFKKQELFAAALGISETSLSGKLNNLVQFTQKEIRKSVVLLNLEAVEIPLYFFAPEVQVSEQTDGTV